MKTEDILRYQAALGHTIHNNLVVSHRSMRKRYRMRFLWRAIPRFKKRSKDMRGPANGGIMD